MNRKAIANIIYFYQLYVRYSVSKNLGNEKDQ